MLSGRTPSPRAQPPRKARSSRAPTLAAPSGTRSSCITPERSLVSPIVFLPAPDGMGRVGAMSEWAFAERFPGSLFS